MKVVIFFLTIPYFIAYRFLDFYGHSSFVRDYVKCCMLINSQERIVYSIPSELYNKLILAEDHRSLLHYGVDPFSVLRCVYVMVTKKTIQGGSTIEQQLVRTITGRYERSLRRKVREQILAVSISLTFKNKELIGKVYINNAYYGHNKIGFSSLSDDEVKDTSEVIARLKYPTRKCQSPKDNIMIQRRKKYINSLLVKLLSK